MTAIPTEEGFYWVKLDNSDREVIAEWKGGTWWTSQRGLAQAQEVIGERLVSPDDLREIEDELMKAIGYEPIDRAELMMKLLYGHFWRDNRDLAPLEITVSQRESLYLIIRGALNNEAKAGGPYAIQANST